MSEHKKKILVIGGTGAMGVYLVPLLASLDYTVHVVSLDHVTSQDPAITYIKANAKDVTYLSELLRNLYYAIVYFMIYSTQEFLARHELLLGSTDHYIYLSIYSVYADSRIPLDPNSLPDFLDVSDDKGFSCSGQLLFIQGARRVSQTSFIIKTGRSSSFHYLFKIPVSICDARSQCRGTSCTEQQNGNLAERCDVRSSDHDMGW